jgi:DNA-binding CsgD family transcriptional regulator
VVFSNNDAPSLDVLLAYVQVKDRYELWKSDIHLHGGGPLFLRDYYSRRQFRNLDIYATTYRAAGLDNHCAIPLCADGDWSLFFSVQRRGRVDFTESDRALLSLLQPHLRNARDLAKQRTETGPLTVTDFAGLGLTPREQEVFFWLMEGKRNPEIGHILHLRTDTVKSHVERIFTKLHVESRSAAMRLGFEHVQGRRRDEWRALPRRHTAYFIPAGSPHLWGVAE